MSASRQFSKPCPGAEVLTIQSTASRPDAQQDDKQLKNLEVLVDELIKPVPHESRVRACMQAVGLVYSADPISRMNMVLTTLDDVRCASVDKQKDQNL